MDPSSALRIAVLVDNIESDYRKEVVAGITRAARTSNAQVLVVAGGWLNASADLPPARNFIYELLPQARLDGMIVLGGSLARFCGIERFQDWMQRFGHIPCVTIGLEIEGFACVAAPSTVGIHAAIGHLVEVHRRRRIAFIRGPSSGPEAESRFQAYSTALVAHGLHLDERLVVELEQLDWSDGMAAVGKLFDKRRFTPRTLEAILCVNDDVARGVLEGLRKRSITVPDQVAVVGFDNGSSTEFTNPPLTTVDQRVEQQGYLAARNLLAAIEQGDPPASESLETQLVLRSSCGCPTHLENASNALSTVNSGVASTCRLALLERRATIATALVRAARGRLANAPEWEQRVLDALLRDLTTGNTMYVVREFESLAHRYASDGSDISTCHDVLTALRLEVLCHEGADPKTRPLLEDLLQEARMMLGRVSVNVERSRQEMLGSRMRTIARRCVGVLERGSVADLTAALDEQLTAIGIQGFTISRFCEADSDTPALEVVARRSSGNWCVADTRIELRDLGIDATLEPERVIVVEPLESGSHPLGIAALSTGTALPEHVEQLRELLSLALRAIQLHQKSSAVRAV